MTFPLVIEPMANAPVSSQAGTRLLPLPENCLAGRFLQRVKRFMVEFETDQGRFWAHTNNSGTMLGLLRPGTPVLVSPATRPERKFQYTLELLGLDGEWVGVNTMVPNRLLPAAFKAGKLAWASGYTKFKAEVRTGKSRIDGLLQAEGKPPLWVECKNVTMVEDGVAAFPDANTARGRKHLLEMLGLTKNGARAAFFYCVQRNDAGCFAPADYIDEEYAKLFLHCLKNGVEVYPHVIHASPDGFSMGELLPIKLE